MATFLCCQIYIGKLYTSYLSSKLKESKYNGSDVELTPTFKQPINFYVK